MSSIYDPASEDFLHNVFDFDAASGEKSTQHFDSAFEDCLRDMGPLTSTVLDRIDIEGAEPLEQTEDHSMADTTAYDTNSNAAGRFASTQNLGPIFQDDKVGADGNWSLQIHRVPGGSNGEMANARGLIGADSEPIGVSFFFRPTLMGQVSSHTFFRQGRSQ
jgi:hypothetical protein